MSDYKTEILTAALAAREKEVIEYQVNIDNFTLALQEIGDDPDLVDFKAQLEGLLKSSIHEQKKASIMLKVIKGQVENVRTD
jgi:hypothetical protein